MKDVLHHDAIFDDAKLECLTEDVLQMDTPQLETFANDLLTIVKQRHEKEQNQKIQKHLAALREHIQALQDMNYNVLFETETHYLYIWHDNRAFTVDVKN